MTFLWVVLGGTGFMGVHLVRKLACSGDKVLLVNRGTEHWRNVLMVDNRPSMRHDLDWFAPEAALIASLTALTERVMLLAHDTALSLGVAAPLKVVFVDFSCMEPQWMRCLLHHTVTPIALAGLLHKYVYISTDSVYTQVWHANSSIIQTFVSEDANTVVPPPHALLDTSYEGRAPQDSGSCSDSTINTSCSSGSSGSSSSSSSSSSSGLTYGEEKRACEILLEHMVGSLNNSVGQPMLHDAVVVALRLPDVLGPYDATGRFWATVMWVQLCLRRIDSTMPSSTGGVPPVANIPLPRSCADAPMSIVAAGDVACAVVLLATAPHHQPVYNVACIGATTVASLLACVAHVVWRHMHGEGRGESTEVPLLSTSVQYVDDEEEGDECGIFTPDFYPSVECGPLDVTRYATLAASTHSPPLQRWEEVVEDATLFFLSLSSSMKRCPEQQQPSVECAKALAKLPAADQRSWLALHRSTSD